MDQIIKSCDSVLVSLYAQVAAQNRLLQIVRRNLPESLAEYITGCVQKNTEIILFTRSGAAASRLRFHGPALREAVTAASGYPFESLRIRVVAPQRTEILSSALRNYPEPGTIETIRESGKFVSDKSLRLALQRLADTLESQGSRTRIISTRD